MRLRVEARDCVLWRRVFYQLENSVVKTGLRRELQVNGFRYRDSVSEAGSLT